VWRKARRARAPSADFPRVYPGAVVVTTRDGGEYVHAEPVNRGAAERALTDAEIVEKYDANATLAVSPARAEAVKAAVLGLDETDGPTLARTLAAD
jgi:hypothetical protein